VGETMLPHEPPFFSVARPERFELRPGKARAPRRIVAAGRVALDARHPWSV